MSLQPNNEVRLMLEVLKAYFQKRPMDKTLAAHIDWPKFFEMQDLHGLQPMLNAMFKKNGLPFPERYEVELSQFGMKQAIFDLSFKAEYAKLKAEFDKHNLPILAFKGFVFSDYLYPESLRAGGDLDLLISKKHIIESLRLLESFDYKIHNYFNGQIITVEEVQGQLKNNFVHEVSMIKNQLHLDIHWGLCYDFLPYTYPDDFLFELDKEEQIFWTLLNHHGGKESWLRLKELADFGAFMQKVGNDWDWPPIIEKMKTFKLHRQFLHGLYLIDTFLDIEIPPALKSIERQINHTCPNLVLKFWNKGKHWKTTFERIAYERILVKSQDPSSSTFEYVRNFMRAYTRPNSVEEKRLITFPENYLFLNFLSKVLTYALNRTFKK
ncbi:nucleotidyltransferase family protein [Marinilongibacter aquaticus]|uniref:nucleotidyltransferase family protein n=1 Tax=Marinilongibacter aquaticus TaxID=2975157 RepID=UPI0021BDC73E|nr:nucleotidyltransferase family protein [Marinilongibacter aquaticus]UBM59001.1 nucleotidyltransferase family protein [Marinilongibacter aquaticus]